jgi:Transcriptional regulator, AbiEi antitoxin
VAAMRTTADAGSMPRELPEECRDLLDLQRGVLSRAQALELGIGPRTVSSRLRRGHWQRLHQGVYVTFTGQPDREAILWAALRRAGPDAVLSHWTAAELSGLTTRPSGLIHVTVPLQRHLRPIPGIVIHRSARADAARHPSHAPPRTRIEETTLDLAVISKDLDGALAWLARACGARLTTPDRLGAAMTSRARMRWRQALTAALDDIAGGAHSVLELRYVSRVERPHHLPQAQRQVRVVRGRRTEYKDMLYAEFGVGVETDGAVAHPLDARWRDQHRDNAAAVDGIVTLRYSWADVTQRPCGVAAQVAAVLRQRGWRGIPRPCGPNCPISKGPQA